jgi:REP element-mobilizing transposase RayT
MRRRPTQLSLPPPRTWGGRRRGAGRKPSPGRRRGVPHRQRPAHLEAHPVHVTLRASSALACLRSTRVFPAVRRALAASSRGDFRIVEFSVQNDHVHLIAEAEGARALSGGVRGLAIRLARAVNGALGRRGRVWDDRYHARALTTPRAVRHALVYVLTNFKKHRHVGTEVDPCSSAPWFTGWRAPRAAIASGPPPVVPARTWLARIGWRRHGMIDFGESPKGEGGKHRAPARH